MYQPFSFLFRRSSTTEQTGELHIRIANGRPEFLTRPLNAFSSAPARPQTWLWSRALGALMVAALWVVPHTSAAASYTGADIIAATNSVRQHNGVSTLTTNSTLNTAAHNKANDMFAKQYFNHYSPTGESPWVWFKQAGYNYTEAGENLAIDFIDAQDVVNAWMGSATHRQNLLNDKFNDIGVAVVDGTMDGRKTTIVVQFFGSRTVVAAAPAPTPAPTPAPQPEATPTPVPAPQPEPTPVPTAPVTTRQAVVEPEPAPVDNSPVPSLVVANGMAIPTLTLTLQDPPAALSRPLQPRVEGAASFRPSLLTQVQTPLNDPAQGLNRLPLMIMASLLTYLVALAGFGLLRYGQSQHPKPAPDPVSQ